MTIHWTAWNETPKASVSAGRATYGTLTPSEARTIDRARLGIAKLDAAPPSKLASSTPVAVLFITRCSLTCSFGKGSVQIQVNLRSSMKLLDISRVSDLSGVPPSALRYYEHVGLIESAGRRGLRRQFGPEALLQLSFIRMGQAAGFSLDEIRDMFGKDGRPNVPRSDLRAKAVELD